MYETILTIHIVAGFISLATAFVAVFSKSLNLDHTVHVYSGRVYFWGMATIFVSAVIMSLLKPNAFLLLIAIFSFYLTLSGWRLAKNRKGTPETADWALALVMGATGILMVGYGVGALLRGASMGVTILVFGLIGLGFSFADVRRLQAGGVKGKKRIGNHLSAMMGASIATLTAFIVTNFSMNPEFVLWLAPTALIVPIIVWWNVKLEGGKKVKGE